MGRRETAAFPQFPVPTGFARKNEKMRPSLFTLGEARNQFFILTQDQVSEGVRIDLEHAKALRKAKGLGGEPGDFPGIQRSFAQRFEDAWKALPK